MVVLAKRNESGSFEITPSILVHSLGLLLLDTLNQVNSPTFERLESKLEEWFAPISGLNEEAEILRAVVSILVQQGLSEKSPVSEVLITAWLQTQNVPDEHRKELIGLASNFPGTLLNVIEHSNSQLNSSARNWAVRALRTIPRTNTEVFSLIVKRVYRWLCVVSLDFNPEASKESEKWRSEHFKKLIGTDDSGQINILGIELELVNHNPSFLQAIVPSIIEGFPLAGTGTIFKARPSYACYACSGNPKRYEDRNNLAGFFYRKAP